MQLVKAKFLFPTVPNANPAVPEVPDNTIPESSPSLPDQDRPGAEIPGNTGEQTDWYYYHKLQLNTSLKMLSSFSSANILVK